MPKTDLELYVEAQNSKRWKFFCCPQTALMLGSELDPNDETVDWQRECDYLADRLIAAE